MKKMLVAIAPLSMLASGCAGTPNCDGSDALKVVYDIARTNPNALKRGMDRQMIRRAMEKFGSDKVVGDKDLRASRAALLEKMQYSLQNIVLTERNDDTGAVICKASMLGHVEGYDDVIWQIKYIVEKTSEGNLLATVYGL